MRIDSEILIFCASLRAHILRISFSKVLYIKINFNEMNAVTHDQQQLDI